jgi:putative aldouronate transport system permease protein
MRQSRGDAIFQVWDNLFMGAVLIIMIYPLYFTIIASVSEPVNVAMGEITLYPKGFTMDAYRNVFLENSIWIGYRNTIFYTVMGTLLNLSLTLPAAYVLSKKNLKGRLFLSWYFLFTMYFGGGLIPSFLVVKNLGLLNRPFTLIFLGGISIYNTIVTRIYYQTSIPNELYEAARVDGCSNFGMFFRIALPLSAPIIAVMTLFYAVDRWNDFFTALIYISDSRFYPLQLVLRNIIIQSQMALQTLEATASDEEVLGLTRKAYMAEAMKYALIFIASAPMLIAYPFVQKHFVKGIMIGSLKG